jgi:HEAT repeat protein
MDYSLQEVIKALSSKDRDSRLKGALAAYSSPPEELQESLAACLAIETDIKVQATLLKSLAYVGLDESKALILPFFESPDNRVRANAVEALSMYKDSALTPQFQKMLKDPHNRVKGNALIALSHFSEVRFKQTLRRMTRSSLPDTCLTALYVLSRFEEPWAVSLLGQMALRPDNPVPGRTLKVLELLADNAVPGARPALFAARRTSTTRVLPSSIVLLQPPKVTIKNIDRLLANSSDTVRIFAVQEGAQRLDPEIAMAKLGERLPIEKSRRVLATLVKWIGILASSGDLEVILPYLEHSDPRVRANTLEGLYSCLSPSLFPYAMKMAKDKVPRVRAMAARIIARHDVMEAGKIVKELVFGKREDEIGAALHVIDVLNETIVVELLEHALIHSNDLTKTRVLSVLRRVESRMPLASQLCHRYERGSFSEYESVHIEEQLERLDSSDNEVRLNALERLRFCRSDQAWDIIEELAVSDRSATVRELASKFVDACRQERENTLALHSIGLRIMQLNNLGMIWDSELSELCRKLFSVNERINKVSSALSAVESGDSSPGYSNQSGQPDSRESDQPEWCVEKLFVERRDLLIVLGEAGKEAAISGRVKDPELQELVDQLK